MNLSTEFLRYRAASLDDLDALIVIEHRCFESDRLSKRSFRHHIQSEQSDLIVVENLDFSTLPSLLAYGLILRHRGTRLARLYSLAVLPDARRYGLAQQLLALLEESAAAQGRLYMRLEVEKHNRPAINLYAECGYRTFGEYSNYYEDHAAALRMQKKFGM